MLFSSAPVATGTCLLFPEINERGLLLTCHSTDDYTVNYATSGSVFGPYTRTATPLFSTGTDGLEAPGGADIWNDGVHMLFHAGPASDRPLYTATVDINGGTITA